MDHIQICIDTKHQNLMPFDKDSLKEQISLMTSEGHTTASKQH